MIRNFCAAFTVLMMLAMSGHAEEKGAPIELKWAQLVPPAAQKDALKAKSFLAGAKPPPGPNTKTLPQSIPEGRWLSRRMEQPDMDKAPAVVADLDGKQVRIGGYVVPLDFDATKVSEFLLVPYVGACIHVPPPPQNQIIYIKAAESFEVSGLFNPVYVTGTIRTAGQVTGLAATGYTMDAASVTLRKQ